MLFIIDATSKKAGVRVKTFVTTKDGVLGVRAWRMRYGLISNISNASIM